MNGKPSPGQRAHLAAVGAQRRRAERRSALERASKAYNDGTLLIGQAEPETPAQLEEFLADPNKLKNVLTDTGSLKQFVERYASAVNRNDRSISDQVTHQVQTFMAQWAKDQAELPDALGGNRHSGAAQAKLLNRLNLDPNARASIESQRINGYNAKAPGAAVDGVVPDMATFLRASDHRSAGRPEYAEVRTKLLNAASSVVPGDGGFLIPETLRAELLRMSLETAIVRPRARVIPMESLRVPFPMLDSTTNVGSVYGGIVAYWTEEGAQLVDSSANFGRIMLEAKKLTGYTEAPNELIADSIISFVAFIEQVFPEALAFFEDDAFLNGSGVGQPLGVLTAGNTAAVSTAKEIGQGTATIVWDNVIKMYARMMPASLGRAVWIASIDTFPELATMALVVGTGGSAVWLNNGAVGPPMTILGRPVIFTEKAPTLGTGADLNFVDFGYYLIGDRQALSADSSTHYKFGNDKTAFRVIQRVDGRPWVQSAVTPKNGGNTLSPFVQIAARP